MAKKKSNGQIPVTSIKHKDKRTNIPTEELRDFVADEEHAPKTMLYPRDPSLDPQLVWKGKDEQDAEDLAVPVVPIYIQEKIHPQAIIDALPRIEQAEDKQFNFFADFNGIKGGFERKVDFYSHDTDSQPNWTNRLVLGDSLMVMTSLAEKEGLKGKVQTIYLDPPYGIKFGSNWQVSTRKRDVKDGKAEDATRQPEQVRAFRDTWKLGIHSYLGYLRDRLMVARELLTETGSVFVQIGDENVHLVRCVMDEVLGSENFCKIIPFQKTSGQESKLIATTLDYLVWYAKKIDVVKFRQLFQEREVGEKSLDRYDLLLFYDGSTRRLNGEEMKVGAISDGCTRYQLSALYSDGASQGEQEFKFDGKIYQPRLGTHWKTTVQGLKKLEVAERIERMGSVLRYRRFANDFPVIPLTDRWDSVQLGTEKTYVVETSFKVIERCLLMTTDPGDLILDPTCGSGTTAYVAEQWGRRWITCDTSRVALALARTRLMAAKYPYYLLADSTEGRKKEAELTGITTSPSPLPSPTRGEGDVRKGFVYKRVPHVTLKSIANNPDIKEGMTREQIDAAIAKHADTETLFDQPYEDNKRVRVCGPFSVESLSPHRVLSTADENQDGTVTEQEAHKQQDFAIMILENLKKAGVQNTRKSERLTFDRLDPYAGKWLHAAGEYTETSPSSAPTLPSPVKGEGERGEGVKKRVAVSIGPEHGTVGPQQVKEAAKEAVQGVGFDMLIVCGFAFDPHVSEEVKRYGKLTVLPAKMNPDLAMGDELLKKTGAGNLFMVFGEPDVDIKKQKNGQIIAEIKGLDVYDPTTGQIRNSSTDDIACWFLDTSYNGESFFVRHAYFTGAEEPYDKLKRALKAEIDEAAWSTLYSTKSRPFDPPKTGKIAVKVINHYGDEVLKVFEISA
ncbi:MAG: site-specific DNA-methyltransferase [Deltaproteobacteria bacterium]|nr:site-specific DNA-methyltransferase [Deltaproteobacteria bacterium]